MLFRGVLTRLARDSHEFPKKRGKGSFDNSLAVETRSGTTPERDDTIFFHNRKYRSSRLLRARSRSLSLREKLFALGAPLDPSHSAASLPLALPPPDFAR